MNPFLAAAILWLLPGPPPASPPTVVGFDATRAFGDLSRQVRFGPRVPGTPGHAACRDFLVAELSRAAGVTATRQDFTKTIRGKALALTNIVASTRPKAPRQILLCAHWDTRPTADEEIDEARRGLPIPGANDGASGVAVLLEIARQLAKNPPPLDIGVQFVLFDGEDYGPGDDAMYLGAKFYAARPALPKPEFAILIDMIGDKDLQIYRERFSDRRARAINDKVWAAAKALGSKAFREGQGYEITDDHLPLLDAGIPTIDLIDFDYAPWHTLDDTPEQCAPESLKAVGDVLLKVIADEKRL